MKTTLDDLKDPKFFIERFFWIINKAAKKVPFVFNPIQNLFYKSRTHHDLILKSRKEGLSSLIEAMFLHGCIFGQNENCVTMAHTLDDTKIHMDRVRHFLDTLGRKDMKVEVTLDKENERELFFPHSNSRYWVGTAGSVAFGRGRDITKLHLSEVAHYQDQDVLTGVMEACTPNAWIVMETTANGVGEAFHNLWREAQDPDSGSPWKCHFFAWFNDPTNSTSIPIGVTLRMTDLESRMKSQYHLTNEQVYWYRLKRASMTDKSLMPQEHPSNDQEAFLSSGRHAFNLPKIQEKKLRAAPPLYRGELFDDSHEIKFKDDQEGHLKVWKMPQHGRRYLIPADIGEGIQGGDYSCLDVLDRASWEQVATWRGHLNPGDFGRLMVTIGFFYEDAILVPELNNHGWAAVEAIKGEGYKHLLKTTVLWKDEPEREGFPTNDRTRTQIITALRNANDDDTVFIHDKQTLNEMETFIQNEKTGKFEAQKGCHDDTVMSLAIGSYCLKFLTVDETYGVHARKAHGSPIAFSNAIGDQRPTGMGHRRRTGY
jgi:hypothetical protein